ncbi:hypothetical protein GCM10023066_56160 [Nocardioides kongjuensis]
MSGLPILAGDPHRVIEAPGCYAQVRLVCTDPDDPFDVAGLTFVGVPGVQHFGHAGGVAWGITNAVADDEDVYAEDLVRHQDAVIARGRSGWEPVARRVEQVRVWSRRTGTDVHEVEVLVTTAARSCSADRASRTRTACAPRPTCSATSASTRSSRCCAPARAPT